MKIVNSLTLITSHGTQEIAILEGQRLIDSLIAAQIPWSALSFYTKRTDQKFFEPFTGLHITGEFLPLKGELFAFYQRNIDPFKSRIGDLAVAEALNGEPTSEFIYSDPRIKDGTPTLKQLSSTECRKAVSDCVAKVLRENLQEGSKIVVGVSGGGDSNSLLHAFSQFDEFSIEVYPLILKGLPEWDSGVLRARELCKKYNLPLIEVEEVELRKSMGYTNSVDNFFDHFVKYFPNEDFEFFAIHLINSALVAKAKELGAAYICKGSNLDDLLCDALYALINKTPPRSLPVFPFRGLKSLTPLWMVPKKIIDGCFPNYSIENYQERYPSFAPGRALYYQMSYHILSNFPQMGELILQGSAHTGTRLGGMDTEFDQDFGFEIMSSTPLPIRHKIKKMLKEM
jgi:hypothetical protein